jgi:uncharacterized protein involved in exopolysaccharide biosynthesis
MPETFDAYQYLAYLGSRWRLAALAAGLALAAALAVSLLAAKKYTATVTLVIEPPGGTVLSPIYLEALKTYEHLAASDHLFAQAVEKFRLREDLPGRPIERLKRAVLRVELPRNTRILEISITLPNAAKAHEVALHLAQETMRLNRVRALETPFGYRGELLQLLDPGVVPEKHSWPNLPLNLAAALALALFVSWLYLTMQFGLRR